MAAANTFALDELRVVQVVPTLYTGGLERITVRLSIGLDPLVQRVVIATAGGEPFEEVVRAAGIPIARIPRPLRSPRKLIAAAWSLARVLRHERAHVIHAHNPTAGATAAIARSLARVPSVAIVTTFHGVNPHELGRASRALTLASDFVVGVSPTVTRELREIGISEQESRTVFNAVHLERARSPQEVREEFGLEDAELVATVGRYVDEKNYPLLLEALAVLAERRPKLRALLVGVGPLEDDLRRQVRERGLGHVALVTGRRMDAHDIIAAADVFVLTSRTEAMPLALLEAMALGRAVVSTNVGGIKDAISDGQTGLLVPPADAPALAAALGRVLDDRALRRRLGEHAQRFVREHATEQAMVDRYIDIYATALVLRRERSRKLRRLGSRSAGLVLEQGREAKREPQH
ncbi:MAG: glycosyltransferase [Actinomycetota bacterium]|nr:glycosyltransferase [Actinomycetota bacterium]